MKHLINAAIALFFVGTSAAIAQRDGNDNRGGQFQTGQYDSDRNDRDQNDHDRNAHDQNGRQQNFDPRQNNDGRPGPGGSNDSHNDRPHWSRGDRLPDRYRASQYVVGDWQQHNLRTPPRGYHWVRNDNDRDQFFLTAIGTGLIFEIVNQNQYRDGYQWARGDRLWGQYRDNRYVVADWRGNHLRQPPRGYQWVRINDQTMLAAINGGTITEIIFTRR